MGEMIAVFNVTQVELKQALASLYSEIFPYKITLCVNRI